MLTRRCFLKYTGGTTLALMAGGRVVAAIPGGSLDPIGIPKFTTPLVIPPAMPPTRPDYFEIAVRQFQQQVLPSGMPPTTVWSYGSANHPGTFNYPAFTIEATYGRPITVKWINELVATNKHYLPHLLPVDPTLHWANPPGGAEGRDDRPSFLSTPGPYRGPVPLVTHVHGMVDVGDESDGYAEAWFLPDAKDIPDGYAREGTWYSTFKQKALERHRIRWSKGSATFRYPNQQRAGTLWYHDHTLGMTRLNVYAGPAGFYLIRGGPADVVTDTRTNQPAVLPSGTFEIPIAIQDRSFNADGSLFYPDTRAFFDGVTTYIPATDVSPIWNPEFFGNCMVVNGRTWPYVDVEQRRYRLRVLNGCNSRFLILDFSAIAGVQVTVIGTEGGFLPQPLSLADSGYQLLMSPAERYDLVVDFSGVAAGHYVLMNVGPDEPFGGVPINPNARADAATTGQVMQFRVGPATTTDATTPAQFLRLPALTPFPTATVTRRLALLEEMSMYAAGAPIAAQLGVLVPDKTGFRTQKQMWADPISENPQVGATEIWEIYNRTADAHPIHVHEVMLEVINRQQLNPASNLPIGAPRPPELPERGLKDTVTAYPGEITRLRTTFSHAGLYVWHCHIVEHEDNEMMRPYAIGPMPTLLG